MSISESCVDEGIDPIDPLGMEIYLESVHDEAPQLPRPRLGKRDRGPDPAEESDISLNGFFSDDSRGTSGGRGATVKSGAISADAVRPAKRRRRHGPDLLVSFDVPFPCAFSGRGPGGGCRFRTTCSYHHGDPTSCACDDPYCPRGHAHRRAPRPCDHGGLGKCRWSALKECSFHHGVPESCWCDVAECRRAHPLRVRRRAGVRAERQRKLARERPEIAERNARRLFLGIPRPPSANASVSVTGVHASFGEWIFAATGGSSGAEDPILGVQVDPEGRFAFVEFRLAEVATACLALDGMDIRGWGRVRLERPACYDPSLAPAPDAGPVLHFDTSKVAGLNSTGPGKVARKQAKKQREKATEKEDGAKKISHYRTWRAEQKLLRMGETNGQLRKRYLELFPDGRGASS